MSGDGIQQDMAASFRSRLKECINLDVNSYSRLFGLMFSVKKLNIQMLKFIAPNFKTVLTKFTTPFPKTRPTVDRKNYIRNCSL